MPVGYIGRIFQPRFVGTKKSCDRGRGGRSSSMASRFTLLALVFGSGLAGVAFCATETGCATSRQDFAGEDDAGPATGQFVPTESVPDGDPYANDPPLQWCGPKGGASAPKPPTGTDACPSDKNKPGCACDSVGQQAACWTGLRANRSLGSCKDGVTTCTQLGENTRGWGPCEGQILPDKGETKGPSACKCFSKGQWKIDNLIACTLDYGGGSFYMVSTVIDKVSGKPKCDDVTGGPPPPARPSQPWSTSTLTADCAGTYELCYEIKAGSVTAPSPSDCSLTRVCQTVDYLTADVAQPLPALPSWVGNPACVNDVRATGGYGEMTVKGVSVRCDAIDDGKGAPEVFLRLGYCPERCAGNTTLPECKLCKGQGGDGQF